MKVLAQLITPARYLLIRAQSADKIVLDFVLPCALAAATTAIWVMEPRLLSLNGDRGLINSVSGLIQVLVGFYVATLAAVATFPASSLDELANRLKLDGKDLKRRRLLAYMFGYLALLALILFVGTLFRPLVEGLVAQLSQLVRPYVKMFLVFAYQFVFWQMVSITLFGLHYLTDRIHRSNSEAA